MNIVMRHTEDLIPYERNQKKHDDKQIANVANSIKRFGWQQPIVIDKKDVIVIGHCRLLAAQKLGLDEVPCTVADDLTEDEIRELRIADNKTNESDWDLDALNIDLQELDFDGFDFDFLSNDTEEENPYTGKSNIPQYEPTGEETDISELVDQTKTQALIEEIDGSELSQVEKDFLKLAAYRHLAFNYKKIANYYALADKNTQELMERSALVIIDYDNAIANGYAKLSDDIKDMLEDAS